MKLLMTTIAISKSTIAERGQHKEEVERGYSFGVVATPYNAEELVK